MILGVHDGWEGHQQLQGGTGRVLPLELGASCTGALALWMYMD